MSKYFAVISENKVTNVIVAETLEIAQNVTGLICVEYTQDNAPSIGDQFIQDKLSKPVK